MVDTFWKWVKETRTEKNIIQQVCADALGITRIKYINWEKGIYGKPDDDFLTVLGEVIGSSLEELQEKWDEFEGNAIESQGNLSHISEPIRSYVLDPKYASVIEKAILRYVFDEALNKK